MLHPRSDSQNCPRSSECLYETSCTSVKHGTAMVLRYTGILIKRNDISNRQNDTTIYRYICISLHPYYSLTTGIHQFCNVVISNADFNWFLTCLDFKGFKHFSQFSLRSPNRFIYGNNVNNSSYMHIYGFNLISIPRGAV